MKKAEAKAKTFLVRSSHFFRIEELCPVQCTFARKILSLDNKDDTAGKREEGEAGADMRSKLLNLFCSSENWHLFKKHLAEEEEAINSFLVEELRTTETTKNILHAWRLNFI